MGSLTGAAEPSLSVGKRFPFPKPQTQENSQEKPFFKDHNEYEAVVEVRGSARRTAAAKWDHSWLLHPYLSFDGFGLQGFSLIASLHRFNEVYYGYKHNTIMLQVTEERRTFF